jgi:hypothetical protein
MRVTNAHMTHATRKANFTLAVSLGACLGSAALFTSPARAADPAQIGIPPEPHQPATSGIPPHVPAEDQPQLPKKPDSRLAGETPPEGGGNVFYQLPSTAYPEGNGRGLYGGSLWFSPFHGLQWPVMPRTGMGFSGSVWLDPGYAKFTSGNQNQPEYRRYLQQGRFVLRVSPTYSNGRFFVQGIGEIVLNKDQQNAQPSVVDTDDVSIRVGYWNKFDFQLGRFDVWEVYHLGMGLDLNTLERGGASDSRNPVDLYGANFTSYKEASSLRNIGNVAFHWYPTNNLRTETLGQMGGGNGYNVLGGRQAVIVDMGWLKLKGAGEYINQVSEVIGTKEGFRRFGGGGGVQVILAPYVEFGGNIAYGDVKQTNNAGGVDPGGTYTTVSYGAFANIRLFTEYLLLGVGFNHVDKDNKKYDTLMDAQGNTSMVHGEFAHLQTFAALQYLLAKQLFLKLVVGYAESYAAPTFANDLKYNNEFISIRLRATYLF